MTEAELTKKAQKLVDELQERLGLQHWKITVRVAEVPHGEAWSYGTVVRLRAEHTAEIQVARNLAQEMLAHTIAHEMAHIMFDAVDAMWDSLGDAVPAPSKGLMEVEKERLCNRIAFAVVGS